MRLPNRLIARLLPTFALLGLMLLMSSCSGHDPQDTFNPQGHVAAVIKGLSVPVLWVAAAVFVLVESLLLIFLVRYRDRGGRELPVQVHGNTRAELGWTLAPTLLLAIITVPTIATLVHINTTPKNAMQINVIAHQWWWEFQYPDQKIVTADELHIPAGEPVHVNLRSDDVIHSFWVPSLVGKQDIIPNHNGGGLWFNAYRPGVYDGECAQFCGEQHALMLYRVVAQSRSDFDAWVKQQQAAANLSPATAAGLGAQGAPTAPAGAAPDAAAQAFISNGCVGCHTINGTQAQGKIGPNLTHFASRQWFEEMDNNPQNVERWLRDPQAIKHGNDMKIGKLSEADIKTLTTLLENLK